MISPNLATMTQFYQTGAQNLLQGGQHAHGWNRPVAGVGLPSMSNPNQPGFMAGGAITAPFGGTFGGGGAPMNPSRMLSRGGRGRSRGGMAEADPYAMFPQQDIALEGSPQEEELFPAAPRKKIRGFSSASARKPGEGGALFQDTRAPTDLSRTKRKFFQ